MTKITPTELWRTGTPPEFRITPMGNYFPELQGDFDVKILSGPFYPFNWIYSSWKKSINNFTGHNIINNRTCGHFTVALDQNYIALIYSINRLNSSTWRRLKDRVRVISIKGEKATIIGKIYIKLPYSKKYRSMGYFTLTPIARFPTLTHKETYTDEPIL